MRDGVRINAYLMRKCKRREGDTKHSSGRQGDEKDANFVMEWRRFLFAAVVQHSDQMRPTRRQEPCSAVWWRREEDSSKSLLVTAHFNGDRTDLPNLLFHFTQRSSSKSELLIPYYKFRSIRKMGRWR